MNNKNTIKILILTFFCILFFLNTAFAQEQYTIDELIANADFLMRFKLSMELFYHNQLEPVNKDPYYSFGLADSDYLFFHIITSYSFLPEAKLVANFYFTNPNGISFNNTNFLINAIAKNLYFEHKISESLGINIMDIEYAFGFKTDVLTLIPKSTYDPIMGAPPFVIKNTFVSIKLSYQFIDLDYFAARIEESPLLFLRLTFSIFDIFYTGISVASLMENGGSSHPYLELYIPFGNGHLYSYISLNKYYQDFVFAGGLNAKYTLQFADNHALSLIGFMEYIDPNSTVFEGFEKIIEYAYANDPIFVNHLTYRNISRAGFGLSYLVGLFEDSVSLTTGIHLYKIFLNGSNANGDKMGGTVYGEILLTYFFIRFLAQYYDLINFYNNGVMLEIGFKISL